MSYLRSLLVYMVEGGANSPAPEAAHQISAFIRGKHTAVEYFFQRYSGPLYNFVLRYLGDQEEAEDMVQEAFARLICSREKVNPERGVRNYLYTIALNLCRNRHRRSGLAQAIEGDMKGQRLRDLHSGNNRSEKRLELAEMEAFLEQCIDHLPDEQRTVLLLRKVNQMAYEEIAGLYDCSTRTIHRHMKTALDHILKLFEQQGYAEKGEIRW